MLDFERERLTCALFGLARCTDSDAQPTESTYRTLAEGLIMTAPDACADENALREQLRLTHEEKRKLAPMCFTCPSPCGRHSDLDMREFRNVEDSVLRLREQALAGIRALAAVGRRDDEINRFFCDSLFQLGYEERPDELNALIHRAAELTARAQGLADD